MMMRSSGTTRGAIAVLRRPKIFTGKGALYAPKTKRVPTAEWITLSGSSARTRS
jgi:hypothetical protein